MPTKYPIPYAQLIGTGNPGGPIGASINAPVAGSKLSYYNRSTNQPGARGPSKGIRYGGVPRGLRSGNRPAPPPPNPLDQLLALMQSMIGQTGPTYEPDLENLMAQITGQVDPVYDARRRAIEQLMSRASQRTTAGRRDIEGMYEALAQDYGTQGDLAEQEMAEAQAESKALQGTLQKTISGTYARIAEEQADLYQKLGIEAAAPETIGPQAEDQAFQESQAAQLGNINQQYYNQLGAADQAYYQQGAPLARLEGSNRSADLLSQLQDYLAEYESGITELEGQRTGDIMTAFNQLAQQAQQFAQSQQAGQGQQQWGRLMDLYQIMEPRYSQQQQPGLQSNAEQIAQGTGLDPAQANQLYSAIQQLGSNPAILYGEQINPETGKAVKTTLPAIIRAIGEMQLSPQVKQALVIWAEQSFGR